MKITFLGPAHPYRGGIATFNERLARQFISESKEVDIRTFSLQYPGLLFPGKSQYTSNPPPEDIMIRREINSINPVNWLKMGYRLKRKDQISSCQVLDSFSGTMLCHGGKNSQIKQVYCGDLTCGQCLSS